MAISLMLASARQVLRGHNNVILHNTFRGFQGRPVTGATLGIIGLGRIGTAVAQRAVGGFDMKILYHSRKRKTSTDESGIRGTFYSELNQMLPLCDFVVIACSLNEKTRHLIGKVELQLMKNTAVLVNVGRGAIIKTDDLVTALKDGQIWGAALDVTDPEPLPEKHPLKELPNVILTPHMATFISGIHENLHTALSEGLKCVLIDGKPAPSELVSDLSNL